MDVKADTYHSETLTPPPDGKLSPLQAESTRNASSPMHIMTSQTSTRGPSPNIPLPALDTPPVREYTHHKKAMITSSSLIIHQPSRSNSSSPDNATSPVSIITSHSTYTPSDGEVMSPDSGMSSASSSPETPTDDNNNIPTPRLLVNSTGTPLAPPGGQPFKRRPGRPPGSTKKYKNPYARECRRKSDSDNSNDFSLRKFFEAGGRDYNEYLDWLKKKGHSQNNGMQQVPVTAAPQFSTMTHTPASPAIQSFQTRAPVYPTTPVHQARPTGPQNPLQPVAVPQMPQPMVPVAAQSQSPPMIPPGYRPILIPRTPLPPGVRPGEMLPFVPGFTMVPVPGQPPVQPQPMKSPGTPHKDGFSVLDLSAKRHRMEPEIPHDLNERLRPEIYHRPVFQQEETQPHLIHHQNFQRELPKETRLPVEREEPSSPTKMPIDQVESSTPEVDLSSWDIENVVKFVTSVPGCTEYADTFREHKIDGATLPHLSESHLLNFVKMKLGPAIRLRLAIARLKSTS